MFNGHNIYTINNKTDNFFWRNIFLIEKKSKKKVVIFSILGPYQNETDPQHCEN